MEQKQTRMVNLDVIRLFACFTILTIHFNASISGWDSTGTFAYNNALIPNYYFGGIYLGEIGNTLFFILSGAALQCSNANVSRKNFLWKRAKAIYPAFWIAFVCALCFDMLYFRQISGGPLVELIPSILGIDIYVACRGWFGASFWQVGEWFLGCIIFCYLAWALIMPIWRKYPKGTLAVAAVAYFPVVFLTDGYSFGILLRLIQMLLGAAFIRFFGTAKRPKLVFTSLVLAILCIIFQDKIHNVSLTFAFCWALFLVISLIVECLPGLFGPIAPQLAKASAFTYPLFLIHHKLIRCLCARYDLSVFSYRHTLVLYITYIAISVFLAFYLLKAEKKFKEVSAKLWHFIDARLFVKQRNFAKCYKKELHLFRKYALLSRFHLGKYKSNKVLLLRLDLIGDCTMFTDAAKTIRGLYKGSEMTVVCLSISRPVFENLGIFDKIISLDFRPNQIDEEKLTQVINELRKESYDILLQPQVSKTPLVDILAAATKCNRRITIDSKPGNSPEEWIKKTNYLYDQHIPYPRGWKSEFDYYGAFVRGLGCPDYKTSCPTLNYGEQHFINEDYYILYPAGSLRQKFWPAEKFAKLAEHIYQRTGLIGVILGVADEQWVADALKENLSPEMTPHIKDLTGKTAIKDVIDLIGNAKFVVSNDTSGVHIACATKTPSVVIVGGWHYDRFLPYHIENVKEGDRLPLVANTKTPCYCCDWVLENVGKVNPACLQQLQEGGLSICIEKIEYEQVEALVDQVIDEEKLC